MKKYSVAIMGPVGSGKSTLIDGLKEATNSVVISEPWESNQYIKDLPNNAFSCQWRAMDLQLESHLKMKSLKKTSNVLMDRTLYETFDLFCRQFQGDFTPEEFAALRFRYESLLTSCPKPDVVVYVKTSPVLCWDRIKSRGRKFESEKYSLTYCQDQSFLCGGLASQLSKKLHLIEVNGDASEEQVRTEALRKLRAFERFQLETQKATESQLIGAPK